MHSKLWIKKEGHIRLFPKTLKDFEKTYEVEVSWIWKKKSNPFHSISCLIFLYHFCCSILSQYEDLLKAAGEAGHC